MIIILVGYFYKSVYFAVSVVFGGFSPIRAPGYGWTKGRCFELSRVPDYISGILRTLETAGFQALLVGGCLRDMLLDRPIHDWDIATSARSQDIISLFPKTVRTGERFGTVMVVNGEGTAEVTTFRSDGAYSDGRRPDSVAFVSDLYEDLKRRDFTINAMALGEDGALVDPYGGREDLERQVIRCVGDPASRFSEDALRMFRALRFSAQLGFEIDADTMAAIEKCAGLCAALSAERVRDETEKILLSGRPERAGTALSLRLYQGRIKDGALTDGKLRRLAALPKEAGLRWCAFCALLFAENLIHSPSDFLREMRLDTKTVRDGADGVKAAQEPLPESWTDIKRLLAKQGIQAVRCAAAAEKALRDTNALETVSDVLESGECFSVRQLAITGDDLMEYGFKKGIILGNTLKALLAYVIENPQDNRRKLLIELAQEIRL